MGNPSYQGSSYELLKLISDQISEVLAPASDVSISAPVRTPVDVSVDFALNLFDALGVAIPEADITAGTVQISRLRGTVVTSIVSPTAASKIDGRVWYTYGFPNASWQVGDSFRVIWEGVEYIDGVDTVVVPTRVHWGSISSEADVAADVGVIKGEVQHAGYGLSALDGDIAAARASIESDIASVLSAVQIVDGVVDANAVAIATVDSIVDWNAAVLGHATYGLAALKVLIDAVNAAVGTVDDKVLIVDGVVDANKALLEHATYGLSALKTLIDAVNTAVGTRATPGNVTTAHSATDALIQGLHNLSQAQAETACRVALNQAKPESVVAKSVFDMIEDGVTGYSKSSHSLVAISKKVDAVASSSAAQLVRLTATSLQAASSTVMRYLRQSGAGEMVIRAGTLRRSVTSRTSQIDYQSQGHSASASYVVASDSYGTGSAPVIPTPVIPVMGGQSSVDGTGGREVSIALKNTSAGGPQEFWLELLVEYVGAVPTLGA